jgi:hypothetical protein
MTPTVYQNARFFVSQGISVFPVHYRGKKPALPHWEPYKDILPTDAQLREWFPTNLRNYAVVLGWQNLAVLDFDNEQVWYEWNHWRLEQDAHPLDNAYMVKTARGMHVYFILLEARDNLKLPGIDFKTHGYVIGPGSTHPTGALYQAVSPWYLPIVDSLAELVPAEILEQAVSADYQPVSGMTLPAPERDLWDEVDNPSPELFTGALSIVDTIKARWRVEQFFPGVKPAGKWMRVCCPFHDDKEPSAWVNVEKQLFGCHSCNMKPMSVIGLYAALYTGGDIQEAIRKMR